MNQQEFCIYISNLAIKSILYEVSTTPKPGLVDRNNSGAHKDMDFFTFLDSSISLYPYFYKCTKAGMEFKGDDLNYLMEKIRPIGIEAEKEMFKATKGVNTQKGLVFSLGIIAAAVGYLYKKDNNIYIMVKEISNTVQKITKGITRELNNLENKTNLTYGERLYKRYKTKGIRGEAESGFATAIQYGLPILEKLIEQGKYHINDVLGDVLLNLMANTEDGNILGRHNMETLEYVKSKATQAIDLGGYHSVEGRNFIDEMDRDFIEKNISSGGAADLLAITLMLYFLEKGEKSW